MTVGNRWVHVWAEGRGRAARLVVAVVVGLAVGAEGQEVLDHEAGHVELAVAHRPVERADDAVVDLDLQVASRELSGAEGGRGWRAVGRTQIDRSQERGRAEGGPRETRSGSWAV